MKEDSRATVCVTGAAGFIGSWLVMRLLERGYIVRATVRDPSIYTHIYFVNFLLSFIILCNKNGIQFFKTKYNYTCLIKQVT